MKRLIHIVLMLLLSCGFIFLQPKTFCDSVIIFSLLFSQNCLCLIIYLENSRICCKPLCMHLIKRFDLLWLCLAFFAWTELQIAEVLTVHGWHSRHSRAQTKIECWKWVRKSQKPFFNTPPSHPLWCVKHSLHHSKTIKLTASRLLWSNYELFNHNNSHRRWNLELELSRLLAPCG